MTSNRTITHDALRDGWTMTRRELTQLRYAPGEVAGMVIFPGILVVLFGYIFGSAIHIPGDGNYREFLMPGLFAMTALAGVMVNAVLISKDVANGVMDRFRSMPIIRTAVPFGRAATDLLTTTVGLAIMALIGYLVGWRAHNGLLAALAGFGLILLLRFALSWVGTYAGLCLKPETADQFVPLVFPVSMLSNSFVPTSGMPTVLRVIANWNPVSALVTACRNLFGNPSPVAASACPLQHPYFTTIAWSVALLAIFVPLASRRFARP
jgi:ABC-2 type transport system permease protein